MYIHYILPPVFKDHPDINKPAENDQDEYKSIERKPVEAVEYLYGEHAEETEIWRKVIEHATFSIEKGNKCTFSYFVPDNIEAMIGEDNLANHAFIFIDATEYANPAAIKDLQECLYGIGAQVIDLGYKKEQHGQAAFQTNTSVLADIQAAATLAAIR